MKSRTVLLAVILGLFSNTVWAEDIDKAREHFERGSTQFDLQRFVDAAHEYELSFEAAPDPVMLFNIGQAYRLAGDPARASRAYKTYLARVPDARNAADVRRKIAELDSEIAEQARRKAAATEPTQAPSAAPSTRYLPAQAPPPPPILVAPPERRVWYRSRIGWGLSATGLALMAVGIGFAVEGQRSVDLVTSAPSLPERYAAADRAQVYRPVGYTLLGVGGAALAGAVIGFALEGHRRRVAFSILSPHAGLAVLVGGDL